jgi:hypothetical protein
MNKAVPSCAILISLLTLTAHCCLASAEFGPAENALSEFRSVRYENVYTKVPTSGKVISLKITDSGKIFYICREKTGYAVYHLEVRPIEGFKDKIDQELREQSKKWDQIHPDDLLLTKKIINREVQKRINNFSEAVWVRNEILVEDRGR